MEPSASHVLLCRRAASLVAVDLEGIGFKLRGRQ
jgi:hypothetical protein